MIDLRESQTCYKCIDFLSIRELSSFSIKILENVSTIPNETHARELTNEELLDELKHFELCF